MKKRETVLSGGHTTVGVVQIDDTVHRPLAANADYVRLILRQLESVGFAGAPRYLGVDPVGREILSFVPGDVPVVLGDFDDGILEAAAGLIRRFHDATAPLCRATSFEIACHNDLSPCNTVFRDGRPVAFIDFDALAPGLRSHDLGYAAWLWLDIGDSQRLVDEQKRRLALFLAAYGAKVNNAEIVEAMIWRQSSLVAEGGRASSWAATCLDWTRKHLLA